MIPVFARLVRSNAKKVGARPHAFYFFHVPKEKRQVLFVGARPGKASSFGSSSLINAHLTKRQEQPMPRGAKYCAGTVSREEKILLFDVTIQKEFLRRLLSACCGYWARKQS